jgi:hypothetical protein
MSFSTKATLNMTMVRRVHFNHLHGLDSSRFVGRLMPAISFCSGIQRELIVITQKFRGFKWFARCKVVQVNFRKYEKFDHEAFACRGSLCLVSARVRTSGFKIDSRQCLRPNRTE